MNTSNKLTIMRIVLSVIIIVILMLPFETLGLNLPKLFVNELIVIDVKYIFAGILFIIAAITDILDGIIARKRNCVTELGKILDAIADKILVNPILIVLSATGFVHPIIPVVVIARDIFVDSFKMIMITKKIDVGAIKVGKVKTVFMMLGIIFTLFYNMPFETMNIKISDFLLIIATTLSVVSAVQYYNIMKKSIVKEEVMNIFDDEVKSA